jgi:hypothetical protein
MFINYESKPVIRSAHKVVTSDVITKAEDKEATYMLHSEGMISVTFKAYEEVKIGDYIVYLDATDIYHCSAKIFSDRNIVPE